MPSAISALDAGNPDGEDDSRKASKLAARAARFNKVLPGNRYKELEEMRIKERKAFEAQGLIKVGKTQLGDAVDMRGTCETMCSEYEREFRDFTREVHPFERASNEGRMDPSKAVAAYSRSDAGAGHGDSAILPSDLRTPATLVRTLDYLFSVIMTTPPPATSASSSSSSTPRKALGYSAGFIRDRSRAIRKEFAMQSSWGHQEAIESFERIARWHILCLRELQEESGTNVDLHIDSAELNRCFTSLRQHYNDRREELNIETPCPNEAEFTAYMLIYDLNSKSVSIPFSELPSIILDNPIVKIAWEIRRAAQRNFDTQKEGSKHNAELGMNLITRFVKLLKRPNVPFLLAALVEIRLREIRRSALRALRRPYPALKSDAVRLNEMGEVVERKMILLQSLNKILGCEEQEKEDSAWDDVDYLPKDPNRESVDVVKKFGFEVYEDQSGPVGSLINLGSTYDDNRDAPYTRRWNLISEKRGNMSYVDIVNGNAGTLITGSLSSQLAKPSSTSIFSAPQSKTSTSAFSFTLSTKPSIAKAAPAQKGPTFFAKTPPEHLSTVAAENKTSLPSRPPIPAESSKSTRAQPSNLIAKKEQDLYKQADNSFGPTSVAGAPTPKPPSSTFTFSPPTSAAQQTVNEKPSATNSKKRRSDGEDNAPPAKAPLFSSTGLFSAALAASTQPSMAFSSGLSAPAPMTKPTSPTLPPFSIPKPISPKEPILSVSTISPIRQRKRLASSVLSSSTSKLSSSILRKSRSEEDRERKKQLQALPDICDLLLDEVIESMISDHLLSDIERLVKQQKAAAEYQRRKVLRSEAILDWSKGVLEKMVDQETKRISRNALLEEIKRRYLTRRAIRHWNSWAKAQRCHREDSEKKRSDMLIHLKGMGLSKSTSRMIGSIESLEATELDDEMEEIEHLDGLQIDIEINHAERTKDNFFSPSTFLTAITKHVGPLLAEEASSESIFLPSFHTVISIPSFIYEGEVFGSPPDIEVQLWLNKKFIPPNQLDDDDDDDAEIFVSNNVQYNTKVLEYGRKVPSWDSIGLYVFQVPLESDDEEKNAENIAECQDRIGILVKALERNDTRYVPSLILLTFDEETIEALGERLQISDELDKFARKSIVSLRYSDDLDERFSKALQNAIPELVVKDQFIVRMNDVISAIYPSWSRFLDISQMQLNNRIGDTQLSSLIFKNGIELVNSISSLVKETLEPIKFEDDRQWKPLILPEFKSEEGDMSFELVDRIVEYMSDDLLVGIDDIELVLGQLRQSAQLGHSLPIIPILQSLSYLTLSELNNLSLKTNLFFFQQNQNQNQNQNKFEFNNNLKNMNQIFINKIKIKYENILNKYINEIFILKFDKSFNSVKIKSPINSKIESSPSFQNNNNNNNKNDRKRKNSFNSNENISSIKIKKEETKFQKNLKLLKALKEVEKTLALNEMETNDLGIM
ncbi:uncharacterized protein I206_105658 [Kwoniella pini CBS 10737]|uniref:SAC3/GANP/THP3 conserved domain-containing protein n=1 Tax=Kwoniella pini CBS 10737 TaxID=1296096 RepID=A0A1B9I3L5_9TREE|nr:uncharacterized protein I206_03440 [Kwoniella pini CBS 10737]OCF50123.1 hypothetical protein I206_03440 [Kwoniella pini CBS 10737]